ncbi:hypothetical protein [Pyxidicoccus xibeiensis]|uniref:hypothetical protein n=1 Tax=Pyxidicoccus xibeiensis TaxID=2906759 RepID=UPI0020A715C3|nr:hypothetical protein [Pyxidicoccus xibeiensis]MCP3138320.1 hypothetical protein [Pyxidicoccus xibeiensis]
MSRGWKFDVVVWKAAMMSLALVGCGGEGVETAHEPASAESALAPAGWETVANQYQYFTLDKPSTVRFGAGDKWLTRELPAGRVYCFFSPDPAPGQFKTCERSTPTAPPAGGPLSPACAAFYSPDFALSTARQATPVPTWAKPAKGVALSEPTYKTCFVRATDYKADGVSGFARNDYSRRQAFNADSTKQLVYGYNLGTWHVYDANTRVRLKQLSGPASDAEPQWHPTNPDLIYYLPTNGVGMKLIELNVKTGDTRTVGDFGTRLKARWPTALYASTRNEGSPSADRRYWCFMVDDANWGSLGVFTWDRDTNTILGMYDTHGERPDHVSMAPSGKSCVVSTDGALGTTAFSLDFTKQTRLHHKSEHSDIALDVNGDDIYVAVDYQGTGGPVFMVNLRTGVRTDLFPTYVAGTATALHISGKAFAKPGWVVVSTYGDYGGSLQWLHRKVMAVQLKANPTIYTLAHHRSKGNVDETDYWPEPHASVNLDFTRVAFSSNWNSSNDFDVDTYVVEIPAGAVK